MDKIIRHQSNGKPFLVGIYRGLKSFRGDSWCEADFATIHGSRCGSKL